MQVTAWMAEDRINDPALGPKGLDGATAPAASRPWARAVGVL